MIHTVVHLSDSLEFGGTEQIVLQLLAGLDRERWRPVLVHQPIVGASELVEGARSLGIACVPSRSAGGFKGLMQVPQVVRRIRSMRPAVFHAHLTQPLSCKFGLIAASLARVPVIVATSQLFMDLPRGRAVSAQHRVVSAGVDRYFAVSNEVAFRLRERFGVPPQKLRVVHNGIALDRFRQPANGQQRAELTGGLHRRVILTVARLDKQKGHRHLLQAAMSVPDALFVLAGDGDQRAELEQQAHQLGVSHRIRFLGHRRDVPELLDSCDLFVLPSLYEGLPLAVLEAMAAGKPVVATAIGGTDEAVVHGRTGLLVPHSDPAALAAAIRRILDDDAFADRLGAAGRARVAACFSSEAMVEGIAAAYDELLHPGIR